MLSSLLGIASGTFSPRELPEIQRYPTSCMTSCFLQKQNPEVMQEQTIIWNKVSIILSTLSRYQDISDQKDLAIHWFKSWNQQQATGPSSSITINLLILMLFIIDKICENNKVSLNRTANSGCASPSKRKICIKFHDDLSC